MGLQPLSGSSLWLDASTLQLTNGAAVTSLSDLSGNHNDAQAIDLADAPTFNAVPQNGLSTIHFGGGTQGLQTMNNLGITGDANRSIFVVMQKENSTDGRMLVLTGVLGAYQGFGIDAHNTDQNVCSLHGRGNGRSRWTGAGQRNV